MIQIYVIVEGKSEERFVKEILTDYLVNKNIGIVAEKVITGKNSNGKACKGGGNSYRIYKNYIIERIKQYSNQNNFYFSTMIDYYAIPGDFPKLKEAAKIKNIYDKINFLEERFEEDIGFKNFIPYLQLHEFETLCFSDINAIQETFFDMDMLENIRKDIKNYENIELINDSKETAPSKRLDRYTNGLYCQAKVSTGLNILKQIDIEVLRQKCQHFDDWLKKMEGLSDV